MEINTELDHEHAEWVAEQMVRHGGMPGPHLAACYLDLVARGDALRKALSPFKALADEIEHCAAQFPEGAPERDPDCWFKGCTWADLVAARDAIEKTEVDRSRYAPMEASND